MTQVLITDAVAGERLIDERRASGLNTYDEMWEGIYHVVPAGNARHGIVQAAALDFLTGWRRANESPLIITGPINIGRAQDYRVPDAAVLARDSGDAVYVTTAELVVEVRSPDDDTYRKFPFYCAAGVAEVLVLDPQAAAVQLWVASRGKFMRSPNSKVLGLDDVDRLLGHLVAR